MNTPYKAGLVGNTVGYAYINMSSLNNGTIIYIPSGNTNIFVRMKGGGNWGDYWYCFSLTTHEHDDIYYRESEIDSILSSWKIRKNDTFNNTDHNLNVFVQRIRNVCYIQIYGKPTNCSAGTEYVLCTIPEDYRPYANLPWDTYSHQGNTNITKFVMRVYSDGSVIIKPVNNDLDSNQFINICRTYPVW